MPSAAGKKKRITELPFSPRRMRHSSMRAFATSSPATKSRWETKGQESGSLTSTDTMRFFFNYPATTEIYTLSLHDALPIFQHAVHVRLQLQYLHGFPGPRQPQRRNAH